MSERGSDRHVPASLKPMSQPIRRAEDQGSRDEGHHSSPSPEAELGGEFQIAKCTLRDRERVRRG